MVGNTILHKIMLIGRNKMRRITKVQILKNKGIILLLRIEEKHFRHINLKYLL